MFYVLAFLYLYTILSQYLPRRPLPAAPHLATQLEAAMIRQEHEYFIAFWKFIIVCGLARGTMTTFQNIEFYFHILIHWRGNWVSSEILHLQQLYRVHLFRRAKSHFLVSYNLVYSTRIFTPHKVSSLSFVT